MNEIRRNVRADARKTIFRLALPAVAIFAATLCLATPGPARAQAPAGDQAAQNPNIPDDTHPVVVELITDVSQAAPKTPFQVGVSLKIAPEWHVYAPWPGNTGEPTRVDFTVDPRYVMTGAAEFQHPRIWDRDDFDLTAFGYANTALIKTEAEVSGEPEGGVVKIGADVSWLACKNKCVGGSAFREITIPVGATAVPGENAPLFTQTTFPADLEPSGAWLESIAYDGNGVWDLKYRVNDFATVDEFAPQWIDGGDCMVDKWTQEPAPGAKAPDGGQAPAGTSWIVSVKMRGSNCLPFAGGFLKGARIPGEAPGVFRINAFSDPKGNPWTKDTDTAVVATAVPEPEKQPRRAADQKAESISADRPQPVGFSWYFLLLAFAGGLLLNVMPCVIPVIIPKLNHLVKTAVKCEDRRERHRLLLLNGLAYTAGILATMMAFAALIVVLKAVGHEVGWGFQFQNPYFLSIMCAVLMLMSLGMLEVFPLQMISHTDDLRELRATRKRGVLVESFLTGLLVTFLGTPCTAPLLGPAAGFAFLAGPGQIFAFFAALGMGFALPFLLLALLPGWSSHLGTFRVSEKGNKWSHGLSFFLLATMVWLIGVVGGTYGLDAVERMMWFLLVLSAAAWVYGLRCTHFEDSATAKLGRDEHDVMRDMTMDTRQQLARKAEVHKAFNASVRRNRVLTGGLLTILVLLCGMMLLRFEGPEVAGEVDDSGPVKWRKWSQPAVDAARAEGKTVFVDFTARWCMNCRTNEKVVLDRAENADLFRTNGVEPFKADFSRRDPEIAAAIESYDRVGVPVYLVYPPCTGAAIVLPEILTPLMVRDAIKEVGPSLPDGCPTP